MNIHKSELFGWKNQGIPCVLTQGLGDGSVVAGTYTTVEWGSLGNCRWRPSSVIKGGKGKSMEIIYEWRFVAGHLYTMYAGKM